MITILFSCRVKGNADSALGNFLESVRRCTTPGNVEVLIKFDSDDDHRPKPEVIAAYSDIGLRSFCWSRGEGRYAVHLDHFYLFSERNPRSRFILIGSDDFVFVRPGFDQDILAISNPYCIVGYARPKMEFYRDKWRIPQFMEQWKHNEGVCMPCLSVPLIEAAGNMGYQPNADNWQTLIVILMHAMYGLDIWHTVAPFYSRNPTSGQSGYGPCFNRMVMDGIRNPENGYYFDLVQQQVKNIYLNLTYRDSGRV